MAGLNGSIIGGALLTAGLSALAQTSPDTRYPVWTVTIPIAVSLTLLSQGVSRSSFLERTTLTGLGTIGVIFVLLHSIVHLLRDSSGAEAPVPTIDDLARLVDDVRLAGTLVTMETTGDHDELEALVALTLYRVVQEGLTNAVQHGTGPVQITLGFDGTQVSIEIVNDHAAHPPMSSAGTGLLGMRERVEALGGDVHAHGSDSGDRWVLRVRIPA